MFSTHAIFILESMYVMHTVKPLFILTSVLIWKVEDNMHRSGEFKVNTSRKASNFYMIQ